MKSALCVDRVPRPVFGVAAESGGYQRMKWISMPRKGRREGLGWVVEYPPSF